MAAQVKRFDEHSARWQRTARNKGIDPKLWDRWRQLSPKTRKATNPADYAAGKSVREQIRQPLLDAAANRVLAAQSMRGATRASGLPIQLAAVKRNLNHPDAHMTNARLRRVASMPPRRLAAEIDDSLSRRYGTGERSPFWYEKRG
jgi:hypothetical protein